MLNQECIMNEPSQTNFTEKILCSWKSELVSQAKNRCEFTIQHFAGCVTYSTVSRVFLDE